MTLGILNGWKCRHCAVAMVGSAVVWIALLACFAVGFTPAASGQSDGTASIRGEVADPTGAVIPGATVIALTTAGKLAGQAISDSSGAYVIHGLPPGIYSITATAPGFAAFSVPQIKVAAGVVRTVNATMQIEVQQQQIHVQAEGTTISTSPDANASAVVIKGSDLNSLSDDPDELQNELQALAGPSAGPNGGEVYIDGFTGGQLPPKSAIREIRVNQNPFSAAYDRLGYGRIEIFTKPGMDHLHGDIHVAGNDSVFNSQNPLLYNAKEPPYYSWFMHGSIGGPLSKHASYFVSGFGREQQNENILEALDPALVSSTGNTQVSSVNEAFGFPASRLDISPRVDLQLGKNNTLTIRWEYNRAAATNSLGGSAYALPSQATNSENQENAIQVSDSLILTKNLVDDIRFQYRRVRDGATAVSSLPTYTLAAGFTDGGNNSQKVQDHENNYEFQDYFSGMEGAHSLNFGTRLRAYQDANYTTSGSNGSYMFTDAASFQGCLSNPPAATCQPAQYTYTQVNNPVARATLFDAALYYQDDWTISPRFTFSYGMRWETQNYISDKNDWAPRLALAYALGHGKNGKRPKTVVRAGYGWFYDRFTVPNGFGASTPYLIQAIHQNGINEREFIQTAQAGQAIAFNPYQTTPISSSNAATGRNAPTVYSLAPHFHAALDMEAAAGVDRQLSKRMTGNVTYIFSQGIHQFFTDNLSAAGIYPISAAANNVYPSAPLTPPTTNNLQFQSGGFYKEQQVMATVRAAYRTFSFFTSYTYSNAKGDTSGYTSVPSVSSDPGLDYGRTHFDIANRFMVFGNFMLPWKVSFAPMMMYRSGRPYNVTIGQDYTANNNFNARPTFAASCSQANTYSTPFGCLNAYPFGTNEKIIPYGIGTGPSNVSVNMRVAKVIGVGPKVGKGQHGAGPGGGFHGGPRGLGGGGFSGSRGGPGRLDQNAARKYSLTISAWATNVLNHENFGTPSGVMSPSINPKTGLPELNKYFGKSQTLAGGFFGHQTAGNRTIFLEAMFNF